VADLATEYPGFFYHNVRAQVAEQHMAQIRLRYIALAEQVLALCPPTRARSLALTHLEESLMRAIQSLALTGELLDPRPVPTPGPGEAGFPQPPEAEEPR
jgi:hypothetical protein